MANPSRVKGTVVNDADGGTTITQPLNCDSVTNGLLLVSITAYRSGGSLVYPSGVTYNGAAMTKILDKDLQANIGMSVWRLNDPPSGSSYDVVATYASSVNKAIMIIEQWQNVDQTTPINATNSGSGALASPTATTVVTTVNNAYPLVFLANNSNSVSAGSGAFLDSSVTGVGYGMGELNNHAVQATAGTATINVAHAGNVDNSAWVALALTPEASVVAPTVTPQNNLAMLGVS